LEVDVCYTEADLDEIRSGGSSFDDEENSRTWVTWTCPKCKETIDYRSKYYHNCKDRRRN